MAPVLCVSVSTTAQRAGDGTDAHRLSLEQIAPDLNARLIGLERAEGVLFGSLAGG